MSSKHQKGEEQILPYKGSLQNKKNSKKSDIVTIRSGTYLPYVNSDIKIRGDLKKNCIFYDIWQKGRGSTNQNQISEKK